MCIFCKMFNCSDFISGKVSVTTVFIRCYRHRLPVVQKTTISLLCELINLTDNYLVFSGDFNHSDSLTPIS